jgi:hypothetical protein
VPTNRMSLVLIAGVASANFRAARCNRPCLTRNCSETATSDLASLEGHTAAALNFYSLDHLLCMAKDSVGLLSPT